ncbi:MAG TPA: gamma-glutamylcyclotransferase family protein [Cyclobacteriaceae bacterium]|nr:gamma-glutamylcyclotransferase family protein [Cyclobacteriaceae bacterium]
MENTSVFAFYGSLRRGMENHSLHAAHLKYLFSARLAGYKLYSRGKFPVAVKSSATDSIVVEVFKINDESTREMIHKLEMDEGYYLEKIAIDKIDVGIYLVQDAGNYQHVDGGDWVSFFRQKD